MSKDHPRLRRFWWILLSIISACWLVYGAFAMVIGLAVDPRIRWGLLGVAVVSLFFFGGLAWAPLRRAARGHPALVYALAVVLLGCGFWALLRDDASPAALGAGVALMVGGVYGLTLPALLRGQGGRF